ncbi:MAG: MerC domain-containing protein [Caulobacterales bacterium]
MGSISHKTETGAAADGWAMALSGLCLVHCLALPAIAIAAPAALGVDRLHWEFHVVFLSVAFGLTLAAFWPGKIHGLDVRRPRRAMALAGAGLALMFSALVGPLHDHERVLTTIGVLFLAGAHAVNWRLRAKAHRKAHALAA